MTRVCLLIAATVALHVNAFSQKPGTKPVPKPAASPFKNLTDSASYAFGVNIAMNLQQQGFDKVNTSLLAKAMNDVYGRKPLALQQQSGNNAIQTLYKSNINKKYPAIPEGEKFLMANAKKPGVFTLPSGLQYEVIKKADSGTISPKSYDTVVVNYVGTLINGQEFDNSYRAGRPLAIAANRVVQGWTEILQLMHVGDHLRVYIPTELGYYLNPPDPNQIPPGSVLIFNMLLEGVKPAANPPAFNQMPMQ